MRKTELLKGSTSIILLSLLSEKEMYGYEITEKVHQVSEGYLSYKEGTLYSALKRLELAGLVRAIGKNQVMDHAGNNTVLLLQEKVTV
ncbi:PadR family transcriptional regulator, regulatory protein PadR [Virgibacillus subterraneus]|uniref:PadR family transcriptional regulator, regulatory protein PadR n=1 Tax=Virgibacillus subterraneus TaxID=621109 RepID=A0A1H9GCL0_9BACI|nr:PadR family transcriptional regulator [Virgibacillus subterraneus]SEQ47834.1 PadR family transcriptional regulator, regulatory protein PadR [Virgibacillus subterraneus]